MIGPSIASAISDGGSKAAGGAERDVEHARLLRLALGVEESRSYWEHVDPGVPLERRALMAFEQRWFGVKSLDRVRFLIAALADRYDPFPEALAVLRRWRGMEPADRCILCHWHLQLSDPIHRSFTSRFLTERRATRRPFGRDAVLRWLKSSYPERWSAATYVQFASKLLSAASEAGLISPKRDPRTVLSTTVSDRALAYFLHLLRTVRFTGTLLENDYWGSVGLTEGILDQRLRALPGITLRRMGGLFELDWNYPSLSAWAEASA